MPSCEPGSRTVASSTLRTTLCLLTSLVAGLVILCGCRQLVPETVIPVTEGLGPTVTVAVTATPDPSPVLERSPTASLPAATPTVSPVLVQPSATPALFVEGPIPYGESVNGNPLEFHRLGTGPSARLIVGGIHGGYEWNTVELVSETLKYLQEDPRRVPMDVTLYIVTCANPDGYAAGTDAVVARMNGRGVDLNRNWDYMHQRTATHGTRIVDAGEAPFSEPETASLRALIEERGIEAVIFYHSAYGGVVFSGAEPERSATRQLAQMLADAIGYHHETEGVPGQITTGDAIDWLSAVKGIAGAEIELTTHSSVLDDEEYDRNLDGVRAFLEWPLPDTVHVAPGDGVGGTYKVQEGEGLNGIILKFYGTDLAASEFDDLLDQISRANGIVDINTVEAGRVLVMPPRELDD